MIMYMFWFSFILGSNFIEFPLFQTHYDISLNQKKRKTKFKLSTKLNHKIYLASFWRKFINDLIQLIGSTRPKFDVWPNGQS